MTSVTRARLVLQDAMYVRQKLEDETSVIEWRLGWVLAVVLLRAVGHVLVKVDGDADPAVASVATNLFQQWKSGDEHFIFWDFIEKERNSILKEYQTDVTEGPVHITALLQAFDGLDTSRQALLEENIYRPLAGGLYAGEDGRTKLDDAIEWWAEQLAEVDRQVAAVHRNLNSKHGL